MVCANWGGRVWEDPSASADDRRERQAGARCRASLARQISGSQGSRAAERNRRGRAGRLSQSQADDAARPISLGCRSAPNEPPRPRVITMDSSIDELQRLLADNPRGLLHVRDELAGWLGSFDRYGGSGADRQLLSGMLERRAPMYPIASSSMAFPGGSSTHQSLSSAAWCPTGYGRRWPMQTMAYRRASFLSGPIRCRSHRCVNAAGCRSEGTRRTKLERGCGTAACARNGGR